MRIRERSPSGWNVLCCALVLALATALASCSDEPRPRVSSQAIAPPAPEAQPRRTQVSSVTPDRAVIDPGDLERRDAGAVGSQRAAAEIGALPPELLAILHAGPGGPVKDDEDISLELEEGLQRSGGKLGNGAPGIVDDVLAPTGDLALPAER